MVGGSKRAAGDLLVQKDLFEIRAEGRVVCCAVKVPARTSPALGASAAMDMGEWLVSNVLKPRSQWLGLVFDARLAPSVFGPITRSVMERVFKSAEQSRKHLGILVGNSPMQYDQFLELSRLHARQYSKVTADSEQAMSWVTASL